MNASTQGEEEAAMVGGQMPSAVKKRMKRSANFSEEEKHRLAREVKEWPAIWDITSAHHSNKNAVDQAWRIIAGILDKSETECKSAWTALRESYRYHAKVANKNKSGSAGGQSLEEPAFDDSVDWEFGEDLSFLPSTSKKRKTFTTPVAENHDESASPASNVYNYETISQTPLSSEDSRPSSSKRTDLWQRFDSLIQTQENILNSRDGRVPESPFKEALSSFDWMLKQLPKSVADAACIEFSTYLVTKIAQQNKENHT